MLSNYNSIIPFTVFITAFYPNYLTYVFYASEPQFLANSALRPWTTDKYSLSKPDLLKNKNTIVLCPFHFVVSMFHLKCSSFHFLTLQSHTVLALFVLRVGNSEVSPSYEGVIYIYMCIPLSTRKVLRNLQQTINVREVQGQITLDCIIFISFTNTNFGSHHIQSFRPKQLSLLISPCPFHLTLFIAIFDLRGLLALHAATSECLLCKDLSMKIQVRTHLIPSMKFIFERVQRCLD